jgi:hypothetical protein
VIPELPEINSGFASCYPKFSNKIRVLGISGSGSGFGLWVFCLALETAQERASNFTKNKQAMRGRGGIGGAGLCDCVERGRATRGKGK